MVPYTVTKIKIYIKNLILVIVKHTLASLDLLGAGEDKKKKRTTVLMVMYG